MSHGTLLHRRGLLTSSKHIDVTRIVEGAKAKVDNAVGKDTLLRMQHSSSHGRLHSKRTNHPARLSSSVSSSVVSSVSSSGGSSTLAPERFRTRLRKPKSYAAPNNPAKKGRYRRGDDESSPSRRLVSTPTGGQRPDLTGLDRIEAPPASSLKKSVSGLPRVSSKMSPFARKKRRRRGKKNVSPALTQETQRAAARRRKQQERKRRQQEREEQERRERREREEASAASAAVKIQSKMRGMAQRREYQRQTQRRRAARILRLQRESRLRRFGAVGRGASRESVRTVEAWDRVKRVLGETSSVWTAQLEREVVDDSNNAGEGGERPEFRCEDEEQRCFARARKLRALLLDAETQTQSFTRKAQEALQMLERWDQHLDPGGAMGGFSAGNQQDSGNGGEDMGLSSDDARGDTDAAPTAASGRASPVAQEALHMLEQWDREREAVDDDMTETPVLFSPVSPPKRRKQTQKQKQRPMPERQFSLTPVTDAAAAAAAAAEAAALRDRSAPGKNTRAALAARSRARAQREIEEEKEPEDGGQEWNLPALSNQIKRKGRSAELHQQRQHCDPPSKRQSSIAPPRREQSKREREASRRKSLAVIQEEGEADIEAADARILPAVGGHLNL